MVRVLLLALDTFLCDFCRLLGSPAWHVRLEGVYMEVGDPVGEVTHPGGEELTRVYRQSETPPSRDEFSQVNSHNGGQTTYFG